MPGQQDLNGDPSLEEIREMCRKKQDGWSEAEEYRRRTGMTKQPYTQPIAKEECLIPRRRKT